MSQRKIRHPIQPLEIDCDGRPRFKENAVVRYLLDNGGLDMNALAMVDFPRDDRQHFAQLIGYSHSGYGTLSYATDRVYDKAMERFERRQQSAAIEPAEDERNVLVSIDDLIRHDSYGVDGSDFYQCRLCDSESGAGLLNKGIQHTTLCPLHPTNIKKLRPEHAKAGEPVAPNFGDAPVYGWAIEDCNGAHYKFFARHDYAINTYRVIEAISPAESRQVEFADQKFPELKPHRLLTLYAKPAADAREGETYRANFPQEFCDDQQLLHDYIAYANAPDSGFPDESIRLQKLNERAKAMGLNPPNPQGSVT